MEMGWRDPNIACISVRVRISRQESKERTMFSQKTGGLKATTALTCKCSAHFPFLSWCGCTGEGLEGGGKHGFSAVCQTVTTVFDLPPLALECRQVKIPKPLFPHQWSENKSVSNYLMIFLKGLNTIIENGCQRMQWKLVTFCFYISFVLFLIHSCIFSFANYNDGPWSVNEI
jgi:hypothetical protein